jgi:tetratricopeptide (TPR) repeat protein
MLGRTLSVILLGITATLCGCSTAQRPIETIRASGDHFFKAGDWESARDEFAEIVSKYPGDADAQYKLGVSHLNLKETSAARRALEIAHARKPQNREYAASLAEAMFQQGDEARLIAFLRGRANATQQAADHIMLGRYAMALNDPDTARVAFDTAIEIDAGASADPYLDSSLLAERLGDIETAVRRLRQAISIAPHDFRVKDRLREMGEDPAKVVPLPPGR